MKSQLCMTPVKNYTAPSLPTLAESKNDAAMLKELPSRWAKKAKVVACLALVGTTVLTGCRETRHAHHGGAMAAPFYMQYPTEQDVSVRQEALQAQLDAAELLYRTHFGGGGSGPFYVVHITEQEALGIIRAKLEIAGLQLDSTPPTDAVVSGNFALDLFDEERGVGVSHITWEMNNQPFFSHGGDRLARSVEREFAEQDNGIIVGAFFSPTGYIDANQRWWDLEDETHSPTPEDIAQTQAEAKEALVMQLDDQVQAFIDLLIDQGHL